VQMLTRYGLFAVECAQAESGVDPDTLVVRGQNLRAMEAIREAYPKLRLFDLREADGDGTAVELRLPKPVWSRVVEGLVLELDYAGSAPGQRFFQVVPSRRRERRPTAPANAGAAASAGLQATLWAA
jgi:hypothetical protein